MSSRPSQQAVWWMLTIPFHEYVPYLPSQIKYIRGQLERGAEGYLHWQVVVALVRKSRLRGIQQIFGTIGHYEPTRSDAALRYVWKEDSRIPGTQFELGARPLNHASRADWDQVRRLAATGEHDDIPSDIYVRCVHQIRTIAKDHLRAPAMLRTCTVYWGTTGTGKSRRAWEEATMEAFPKNPNTKFWDGYRGDEHVVIDEFRGRINISYLLQWLDRYPVIVEIKGSATVLRAKHIWITSNLDPRLWYPDEDQDTVDALMRRLTITHFQ